MGTRYMETTNKKREILRIMPDKPDVMKLRKQVKGAHYEGVKPLVGAGKLVDGRETNSIYSVCYHHDILTNFINTSINIKQAQFSKLTLRKDGDVQIKGSMTIYSGGNVDEVRGIIKKDIYATSGV
ncbi:uncharacterized protein BDW43DRAFT_307719 [Aspergillus alliaceus]|uniref:uncharacterized protein n=1 Tax=Petromyces alliaceus TaxID=209559 RepID=UPI0012A4FEF3|nr:uncharacterized protein BDW43DRAFT_307719 [Aspergillus alliaceus]KAB8237444.1 hypothetical protein BDW43DRAFT_307719 [Aspergillus alliaceus]